MDRKIDKLLLFDACVDGDLSKFKQLLGQAYAGFNTFFNICKSEIDSSDVKDYVYYGTDNNVAKFGIVQDDNVNNVRLFKQTVSPNQQGIEIVDKDGIVVVSVNIS